MADGALDQVLRLVAEGRLTAEEAEPILAALDASTAGAEAAAPVGARPARAATSGGAEGRKVLVDVREGGRVVVKLRLPVSVGRYALDRIPGLSGDQVDRVREALAEGRVGPVLQVEDEHSSVSIRIE